MWINRKKYEDLMNSINQQRDEIAKLSKKINSQQGCINRLMNMHDLERNEFYSVHQGLFCRFNRIFHEEPTATIGDIDDLTFTELAEYVINSKPITRIREHEVVVCPKKECEEDTNNDGNN